MTKIYKYLEDVIAIVGFFIIIAIFFSPTILQGRLPVPSDALVGLYHPYRDLYADTYPRGVPFKNFLITDPVRQQIPWRKLAIDSWKEGKIPWWNPYTFSGTPLAGNIQAGVFYPLNIIFFLFSFPIAWTVLIVLQQILAGLFLYIYLRHLSFHPYVAGFGSLVWSFSGFMIAWLTWGTIGHAALWLPLVLLSIDRCISGQSQKKLYWYGLLILSLSMQFLAGHIQVFLYCIFFSAVYGIWKIRALPKKQMRKTSLFFFVSIVVFLLITSVQWIALLQLIMQSSRVEESSRWLSEGWFLPYQHLLQFIAPDFFGNPATLNYWGVWNYGEFIGYIGLLPFMLALSSFRYVKESMVRFWILIAGTVVLFMIPTILAKLPFVLHIPIFQSLQPTRLMVILDFSLVMLASFGLQKLIDRKHHSQKWLIGLLSIVFILVWITIISIIKINSASEVTQNFLVSKRNFILPTFIFSIISIVLILFDRVSNTFVRSIVLGLFLIITCYDLLRFSWKFTPFTPIQYFFPTTKIIRFLQSQPKPFRVMSLDDRILPPNVSAYYGIESIEGYDPIASKMYEDFLVASERGKADIERPTGFNRIYTAHNIDSPLLPYFNVRYVLSLVDINRPFLREIMKEGETRVYEYTLGLPRAYLAEKVIRSQDPCNALSILFTDNSLRLGVYDGLVDITNFPLSTEETVDIIKYRPNEIRLKVSTLNQHLLVFLNRFDARWSARIDNKGPYQLFPVNYLFMGMAVPAGAHDVILSYR